MHEKHKVTLLETFGLKPFGPAVKDCWLAIAGTKGLPGAQFDLSSIRIFKPKISIPAWLGIRRKNRKIPIYNFFNRNPAPLHKGYSVKVSFARDFRGGQWTYDGHLGTDFAVPVGTTVVAAAPGRVIRVANQMDHGGLKVFIDHGKGLITTSDHLARALVGEGEDVGRGQPVALSGASGVELILFFPWVSPHLHFNVWLNGKPVDPFAKVDEGEVPLWRSGNKPVPFSGPPDTQFEPTRWDEELIDQAIDCCRDERERTRLRAEPNLMTRAADLLYSMNFRSPLFSLNPYIYRERYDRIPLLDLPFCADDFSGIVFSG